MRRILVIILMVAALVGVVFAPASTAMAALAATRSLPPSATAGADFKVDINTAADYGAFGQVVETLPSGFSYVSCDDLSLAAVTEEGQVVKFTLLGDTSFSYTITASSTAGTYTFSGILKDEDKVEYAIGGDVQITVPAARSLPSSVARGANFDVDISTADYGAFGQVVETLPDGFSYVSCDDLSLAAVTEEGQVVKFTLLGETAFSYTVKASSTASTYAFGGILKDEDKVEYDVGGDSQITVTVPAPPAAAGGGPALDTAPPTFSDILASAIAETTADISWRTNEASTSQVEYWTSPSKFSPLDKTMTYSHLVHLTELTSGTTYHYKTMSRDAAGNLAVSDEDTFTTLGEAPAALFTPSDLSISPAEVNIGETVNVSISVSNTGGMAGSYKVTLKIDGVAEATQQVTIGAGASEEVTFTTSRDVAGSYSVDVNGLSGSFTVKEEVAPPAPPPPPPPPPEVKPFPWPLVGGIIGAVVVVGLLIFFLVVRRRAY